MALDATAALWFLILAAPVCAYTVWTDLAFMKIRNAAVLGLLAIYVIVGFLLLPFQIWAWGWASFAVVLVVGFLASTLIGFGAGDAKFAAGMAPFVAWPDISPMLMLLAGFSILGLVVHRIARRIPAVRRAAPTWESWERPDFPFGTALAPALVCYLALAAFS